MKKSMILGGFTLATGLYFFNQPVQAHLQDPVSICIFQTVMHVDGGISATELTAFEKIISSSQKQRQIIQNQCSIPQDILVRSLADESIEKEDRIMICGSEEMTFEIKGIFEKLGSLEGSTKVQGGFVIEKAFAEK